MSVVRNPYSDPYTMRERIAIKHDIISYDISRFFREGIWRRIAFRLPRKLVYWAVIRCWAAGTNGDEHPDTTTFDLALKRWENRT